MKSKFNQLTGLYEQVNTEENTPAVDTNAPAESKPVPDAQNTGKLHGFEINAGNIAGINKILTGDSKEWKSETPLNVLGKDGSVGGPSMINGKPAYLMVRISTKSERSSSELQLELSDRVYVLLDTNIRELSRWMQEANGKEERVRASVKTSAGKEHSLELWKMNGTEPDPVNKEEAPAQVSVDMEAQRENPGTAAGVSGTVSESINEQYTAAADSTGVAKPAIQAPAAVKSILPKNLAAVKKYIGGGAKEVKLKNGSKAIRVEAPKAGYTAVFYSNGRVWITPKGGKSVKAKYTDGGKNIVVDGSTAPIKGGSVWTNMHTAVKGKAAPKKGLQTPSPFTTQEEGDAFRSWANSTPELAAKYGKSSKFDLDANGKFNNSFIRKAYAAAKDEYSKKDTKDAKATPEGKYKEGDIVYYKVVKKVKTPEVEQEKEKVAAVEPEKKKKKTKYPYDEMYGANPNLSEGIATSFNTFKAITEQDKEGLLKSDDIDTEAVLIKDFKDGNIKKGKVITLVGDDKVKLLNVKSEKETTVAITDILDTDKVKDAAAKSKAEDAAAKAKEAEAKKSSSDKAKENLEKEKGETDDAQAELDKAREDRKKAKKNKKSTKKSNRKSNREDRKQARKKKRAKRINDKTKEINASESVVYNFDEFIKSVNELN
jgi:hypothetical protein